MSDEEEAALRELRAVGIKPKVEPTGSGHIAISWQIGQRPARVLTVAKTGSDWRGRLNARAQVRRWLREDGVYAHPTVTAKLARALEQPRAVEPIPDQMISLRAELADLNEAMLILLEDMSVIRAALTPAPLKPKRRAKP